ncbi:hypothetical protein K8I28_14485 [bacterium]|nr:hypothetical protein [bacterium]
MNFSALKCCLICLLLIILQFRVADSSAQSYDISGPKIGAGSAFTVGNAYTGAALDTGLAGGTINPAAYLSVRNEMILEADVWGSVSLQSGVKSPEPIPAFGSVYYLTRIKDNSLVISYRPARRFYAGGKYPVGELIHRSKFSEFEIAYATEIRQNLALGISAVWTNGTMATLEADNPHRLEKIHRAVLYDIRVGIQSRSGAVRWGVALEPPKFGNLRVGEPVNVGELRDYYDHDYTGGWGAVGGIGMLRGDVAFEFDASVHQADAIEISGYPTNAQGILASTGMSVRGQVQEKVHAFGGVHFNYSETEAGRHLLYGLGATYDATPDITIVGGIGILQPLDKNYAALDDVFPYDLRAGILYHGE